MTALKIGNTPAKSRYPQTKVLLISTVLQVNVLSYFPPLMLAVGQSVSTKSASATALPIKLTQLD